MSFFGKIRFGLGILGERAKAKVFPYNRLVSMSASGELGKYSETTIVRSNRFGQTRTINEGERVLSPEEALAEGFWEPAKDTFIASSK